MATQTVFRFVPCALALCLSACASTTPQGDRQFGASVRATLAAQVADPGAANPDPVAGVDGRAALAAQQRYEHSFLQPAAAPAVLVISK